MNRVTINTKPHGSSRGVNRITDAACLNRVPAFYAETLSRAMCAADDLRGHLHDYADTTDEPVPGVVEVADMADEIMAVLERIACKVDGLPERQS